MFFQFIIIIILLTYVFTYNLLDYDIIILRYLHHLIAYRINKVKYYRIEYNY